MQSNAIKHLDLETKLATTDPSDLSNVKTLLYINFEIDYFKTVFFFQSDAPLDNLALQQKIDVESEQNVFN